MLRPEPAACRAVFLSPHLDAAIFSCGGTIARLRGEGPVLILNVFTHFPRAGKKFSIYIDDERHLEEAEAAGALATGIVALGAWSIPATLFVYLALMAVNALLIMRLTMGLLSAPARAELRTRWWRYLLAAPVASWIYGLNVVRSMLSRRITWRGITYEMVSPTQTRIIGEA